MRTGFPICTAFVLIGAKPTSAPIGGDARMIRVGR
jgi:hypothetical protein